MDALVNDKEPASWADLDKVEKEAIHLPQLECPVHHNHLPGFYVRVFHAPKGAFIISKVHKSRHQWSVSKGVVSVWDDANGAVLIKAGDSGITEPGTRRVLYVHEDLVWSTSHAVFTDDLDEIEKILIDNRENPLMSEGEQAIFEQIKGFHSQNEGPQTITYPEPQELIH